MAYQYPFAAPPSTKWRSWFSKLRLSWINDKSRRLGGAFAQMVADRTIDWATQAVLEHFPEYASPPSVALIASERQIDAGPTEPTAQLAARLIYWIQINALRGRMIGMLNALWWAGFQNAVIMQQNGQAFSLAGPPTLANLTQQLVVTSLATLNNNTLGFGDPFNTLKNIPAASSWWWLDGKTGFCSRFSVLFPGPLPGPFRTFAVAQFNNSAAASVVWNNPFPSSIYTIQTGMPVVTDGGGSVTVDADGSTQTQTGVTIRASAPFSGTATVLAWQIGAINPLADLHPNDLARLRRVIDKWKPAKSTCNSIVAVTQGRVIGWPVRQMTSGLKIGPSTGVVYAP